MDLATIDAIKIREPATVIGAAVKAFRSALEKKKPWPKISLSNGVQVFTGVPVKIDDIRGQQWVALLDYGQGTSSPDGMIFVDINTIRAVSILDPLQHPAITSPGAPPALGDSDVPSRLGIERSLGEIQESLSRAGHPAGVTISLKWHEDPPSLHARNAMHAFLRAYIDAATNLSADPMGKEALGVLKKIEVTSTEGTALDISAGGGSLKVSVGKALSEDDLKSMLKSFLEKAL